MKCHASTARTLDTGAAAAIDARRPRPPSPPAAADDDALSPISTSRTILKSPTSGAIALSTTSLGRRDEKSA